MGHCAAVKHLLASVLLHAGITRPEKRLRSRLLIATFHRVLPAEPRAEYAYPGLVVTPSELDWCVRQFTRYFTCGSLQRVHRRFVSGERPVKPLLGITFDDGQLDNFEHARPVLARHGVTASFFIPVQALETQQLLWHDQLAFAIRAHAQHHGDRATRGLLSEQGLAGNEPEQRSASLGELTLGAVEAAKQLSQPGRLGLIEQLGAGVNLTPPSWAGMMCWEQVRQLGRDGHEIGSHSLSHALMPQCDDAQLRREVEESRQLLEAQAEQPIESFCYPNGDSDARCERAVEAAGYSRAVTTRWGSNDVATSVFALRRCDMDARRMQGWGGRSSTALLAWRVSGLHPTAHRS